MKTTIDKMIGSEREAAEQKARFDLREELKQLDDFRRENDLLKVSLNLSTRIQTEDSTTRLLIRTSSC
jgi:hypothetical protein